MNENNYNQHYKAALNLILDLKNLSVYKTDLNNPLLNLGKPTIENVSRVNKLKVKRVNLGYFIIFLSTYLTYPYN